MLKLKTKQVKTPTISSIIDIKQFALLTFIIPPIMGGQDSNLNFKLLSSLIIPNIEAKP